MLVSWGEGGIAHVVFRSETGRERDSFQRAKFQKLFITMAAFGLKEACFIYQVIGHSIKSLLMTHEWVGCFASSSFLFGRNR
jgi:hypothetical protein